MKKLPVLLLFLPIPVFGVVSLLFAAEGPKSTSIVRIDPPEYGFFSKQITVKGIPVKAHQDVNDKALLMAEDRIGRQLENVPDIVHNLVEAGAEMHIIGKNQQTSDLPYLRHWKGRKYEGEQNIDERTRGVGGIQASCGEENLLKLPGDRFRDHRDICTHEFAHTIYEYGISNDVREKIDRQYQNSVGNGLWKTAYASKNANEFFAELSMWYFGSRGDYGKIEPRPQEGRDWFRKYDPNTYELLQRIYSGQEKVSRISLTELVKVTGQDEAKLRSVSATNPTTIIFDNRTSKDYLLFWLDFEGNRKPYGTLFAGHKLGQNTYATHPWVITDANQNAIAIYIADNQPARVVVR
jgi:hypothetical protein